VAFYETCGSYLDSVLGRGIVVYFMCLGQPVDALKHSFYGKNYMYVLFLQHRGQCVQ